MSDIEGGLQATLLRQAGVITRDQARATGLSSDAVDRRLATRRWHPVHPRVYRDGGFDDTDEARVRAALAWAGEGAVLSGAAAAWWQGLVAEAPAVVGVTVPRRRCPRPRPGVSVRRRELDGADVRTVRGIRVTAPALTVLETAVERGGDGPAFLDRALAGRMPVDDLAAAHARNLGAHGSSTAGRLLADAARRAVAAAEHRLCGLLRSAGVGGWARDHTVAGLRLDLAFPAVRVTVAVHDRTVPRDPERDAEDRWRRAVLRRQGWRMLLVDPGELTARPAGVLEEILRAVSDGPTAPAGAAAS
ncbi:very-short-patch-repair endonuclease [Pseudonocardia sediminis]|uniref:Very-short-patch-repair endonuclease n=1 Tax=Pseudonocardia sediminis TaxID=1397368 RepID=A0A4Q7UST3_PSEST|nr:hypothetical protein [Pseudonocardia sediminis]RZT84044.1 very-short-patch-repair endonuclease [Pseudonocardia sediminis]